MSRDLHDPRIDAQVDHNLYLRTTWVKLQRFKLLTTGDFQVDEQLHLMWGYWRPMGPAESYARQVVRGKDHDFTRPDGTCLHCHRLPANVTQACWAYPTIFVGTALGKEIEELVGQLRSPEHLLVPQPDSDPDKKRSVYQVV